MKCPICHPRESCKGFPRLWELLATRRDDYLSLHEEINSDASPAVATYPSLTAMAGNLARAVGGVVSAAVHGEAIVASEEEQARRLAICHACAEWYDPEQDRCRHGGCGCFLSLKTRIASSHCPLDPPKW